MSAPDAAKLATLRTLVSEELGAVRAFVALLEREQEALVAGDADRVSALAQEKSESLARLDAFALRRTELLSACGLGRGRAAVDAWLGSAPTHGALRRDWDALLEHAARARALNGQNGTLIRSLLAHNHQALGVLLSLSDRGSLYGPDGQARTTPAGRHLGSV